MTVVFLLVRLALFAASCFGWCLALTGLGLQAAFAPIVAFSAMGTVMVAGGLLNIFTLIEWAVYLGGLAFLAVGLLRKNTGLEPWLNLRVLGFAAGCGWLLVLTRGGLIWGHDNMAHWAIAAKTIITENHLPNTADAAVEFTGYPPGTACFIKYFCNFVGMSDGMMMMAQGLLILAALFALTAFIKKNSWPGVLAFLAFAAFLLCGNVPLNDLRVDTILASQGLAALAIIAYYAPSEPAKALYTALPVLTFLALIKNSGLYFVALNLAVLLYFALGAGVRGAALLRGAGLGLGLPLGSYWLWLRHVAMVFPAEAGSKHAVSVSAYSGILGEKTAAEMAQFRGLFFGHLTSLKEPDTRRALLIFALAALALFYLAALKKCSRGQLWLAGGGFVLAEGLYIFSLWCTYTLSMNTAEMLCLASIQRYHNTTLTFLMGAALLLLLTALEQHTALSDWLCGALAAALIVASLILGGCEAKTLYSRAPYHDDSTQGEWLSLKEKYGLTEGSRYLVYTRGGEVDTWTMRYVARYVLNSSTVDFWEYGDQEYTLDTLYSDYDYVIFYAPDDRSRTFLKENGFDPATEWLHLIR